MGAVENLKDLTKCINDFGVKYRVVAEAMATLGKSFASYIENDVKSIYWLSVYSLPNNEKKIMGLPMYRAKAHEKARRNERRKYDN